MKSALLSHLVVAALALTTFALAARGGEERPVSPVGVEQALSDARALAAHDAHLKVMQVDGVSMQPYFGPGSVLVVKPIAAARLHEGMVVVYLNRFGEKVAHRLEAQTEAGWQVKGYNNSRSDSTLVTGANLLGVVYAVFNTDGVPARALAMADQARTEMVLAAPAR